MKKKLLALAAFAVCISAFGQKALHYELSKPTQKVYLQELNKKQLLNEDEQQTKGRLRCAILQPVNKVFPGNIEPEKVAEGYIYRMQIDAPNAEALNLYLEDFELQEGCELTLYNEDFSEISPVYTHEDNPDNGIFVTDHIAGDKIIIEMYHPTCSDLRDCFTISETGYMYRPLPDWRAQRKGFGDSGFCQVNVNCPEGDGWQAEKQGVARILLRAGGGAFWCSGSLINNARRDRTPYFLTADHCGKDATESEFPYWKFYFNYEASTCDKPAKNPSSFEVTGSTKLATGSYSNYGSDFLLLRLNDKVAEKTDLYFNGWTITTTPAVSGVGIHHPNGDIKKISTLKQAPVNYENTHWQVFWADTETNWSVTEGGSSGSPLFNQEKLIVGTLTGGDCTCENLMGDDVYGKMSYHWDKNGSSVTHRLKPWLDPDNTGITSLAGMYNSPVAIKEPTSEPITIWPNPANNIIHISTGDHVSLQSIKMVDVAGNVVMEKHFSEIATTVLDIDISHLPGGIYMVVLSNGKEVKTHKIIKQ